MNTPVSASIDVVDVLQGMGRRKTLIAGITLAALLGGLALVSGLKAVYSSEAQVLVEDLDTPFDRTQGTDTERRLAIDDRIVASQMSVLNSQDLGRRVVAALKLENNPEFNSLLKGKVGVISELKLALGFGEDPRHMTPEQRAIARYRSQLSVYQLPESNVIVVKYSARDPRIATEVANTLAETYVLSTRESQSLPTGRAREWLAQQIAELRGKVALSEAAVERFRTEAGLLQGTTVTLGTQEVSELNTQITLAEAARSEAQARAQSIRQLLSSKGTVDASSDVLASGVIQTIKEQQAAAARQVAELSAVYLPGHPRMIAAQNELNRTNKQLRSEALKVVQGLEQQAQIAEARENSLRASLESLKQKESGANLEEVKLKALEREAGANRVLLETMLSRYADASARQNLASQPGLARIIQSAVVPSSPSFPKRGPMVLLITIAGLTFGLGLAFILEIMKGAARLNDRLTAAANGQPADRAAIAHLAPAGLSETSHPHTLANVSQSMDITDAAEQMAAWVTGLQENTDTNRVVVTSIGGAAGDSSLASLGLARALDQTGRRVIVADLARNGSSLERLCSIMPGPGISELVSGNADFTKVIGRDSQSSVHLLRFGLDRSPAAFAAVDSRVEPMFLSLAGSYDTIVVNAGEAQSDMAGLMQKCEAAVILAAPTRSGDAAAAAQSLRQMGVKATKVIAINRNEAVAA